MFKDRTSYILHVFFISIYEVLIREKSQNKRSSGGDLNQGSSEHWAVLSTENFLYV